MHKVLLSLALTALLFVVVGIVWVGYSYVSISADNQEIAECAKRKVPNPIFPTEPKKKKIQIDTKEEKICTQIPQFRGIKLTMKNQCIVISKTPIYASIDPSDTEISSWQSEVTRITEEWKTKVALAAEKCVETAQLEMKEEIQYWSSVVSGPAPYLLGLFGFVGGMLLTSRKR